MSRNYGVPQRAARAPEPVSAWAEDIAIAVILAALLALYFCWGDIFPGGLRFITQGAL